MQPAKCHRLSSRCPTASACLSSIRYNTLSSQRLPTIRGLSRGPEAREERRNEVLLAPIIGSSKLETL